MSGYVYKTHVYIINILNKTRVPVFTHLELCPDVFVEQSGIHNQCFKQNARARFYTLRFVSGYVCKTQVYNIHVLNKKGVPVFTHLNFLRVPGGSFW